LHEGTRRLVCPPEPISCATRLTTSVEASNAVASSLYARAGFVDSGRRESLGHSDATVFMLDRPLP
jgi:hypothetical protein